jgi:hypothetical protein
MFTAYKRSLWPDGTYALPASMFGCPETEDRGWTASYINLTLPESAKPQQWNKENPTDVINILGPYYFHSIQMNFCLKIHSNAKDTGNMASTEWPRGQYCIYSLNKECPQGES